MAINSFLDTTTEEFYKLGQTKKKVGWHGVQKIALRKLDMIAYAEKLDDLRVPPNNRLEKLKGDLDGFFSIRINDQWRIIFRWTEHGPEDVKICDYH